MRNNIKQDFLLRHNLGESLVTELPMDASARSYDRIHSKGRDYILMNCPPDYTSVVPFVEIASLLRSHGLRAPEIFASDEENGFLLIEDFGKQRIKDTLLSKPEAEDEIYSRVIDLLHQVQKCDTKILEDHDLELLLSGIEVYMDWYPKLIGKDVSEVERRDSLDLWRDKLSFLSETGNKVIALRDFHVENLMDLPSGEIGILDFQDARRGSPVYDLVSVLQDARHDVNDCLEEKMLDYYISSTDLISSSDLAKLYNLLGAQRNLRILGVFARKALRDGQDKYLEFIPRVKRYLDKNLSSNFMSNISQF
ncbi:MAG: phosphotransferase [Rickettsiaceae bacterium]|nr:phosphotransferase [Rickettsiaceae bacterium]